MFFDIFCARSWADFPRLIIGAGGPEAELTVPEHVLGLTLPQPSSEDRHSKPKRSTSSQIHKPMAKLVVISSETPTAAEGEINSGKKKNPTGEIFQKGQNARLELKRKFNGSELM